MNDIVESPFAALAAGSQKTESAGARQNQSRELAETQVKYLMAERFPRNEVAAMDRILNAFTRPMLAEKAQYQFARGGTDIAGPSIRAAEAMAQQWGNLETGWRELSRGVDALGVNYSEVEAFCVDLQARNPKRIGFIVRHWRDTKSGGYKLKDERDIYELCANQAMRRLRACILASIPGDVTEAAMQQAEVTLRSKADTSPEAMAKMLEAFAQFGVGKEHIEKRIQRRLDAITPAQVVTLKRIYASLRDEMSAPSEWFEMGEAAQPGDAGSSLEKVRAATAAKKSGKPEPKSDAATEPPVDAPRVTYAEVRERLETATTVDELDEAATLIEAIVALDQRKELTALYRELRAKLDGE
jgi:hypothetical protein